MYDHNTVLPSVDGIDYILLLKCFCPWSISLASLKVVLFELILRQLTIQGYCLSFW